MCAAEKPRYPASNSLRILYSNSFCEDSYHKYHRSATILTEDGQLDFEMYTNDHNFNLL